MQATPALPEPVRYLALGDSYTKGEGVRSSQSFPVQLVDSLKKSGVQVSSIRIIAQTGWTTKKLNDAIEAAGLEDTFNMVSLLIGVNNQFQGRSIVEYQSGFEALARKAIQLAGGKKERVFIISIPDYGFTPFGTDKQYLITPQIDVFNQVNKEISDSLGLTYFDITDISREGLGEPTLLASDGLHPSAIMYKRWVDLIVGEVVKKVQSTEY